MLLLPVFSQAEDFSYTTSNDEITITGYSGTNNVVVIPETIDGLPVKSIGNSAFLNRSNLTGVTIPSSVTSIGYSAFRLCRGLTSVTIPSSVTLIDTYAFQFCSGLTGTLTIPSSVTTIGNEAFAYCSGLTGTLTIPSSVTSLVIMYLGSAVV
ncbi:MAG: leucine-rich repeat domain-containing protein [Kiritimatiellales bacterium]|nr:leucine-rich repeat domain-containing protein [Kiritimatiellota bacterium]MBL7012681.1 leucine-rich repeat domain-containing protein [Kiritimatiellales bacterium]